MHGSASVSVPDLLGTVHPFLRTNQSFLYTLRIELNNLLTEKKARKLLMCMLMNVVCTIVLLMWCNSTDSLALTAYTYLTLFDMMSMLTCLVTLWVQNQRPSPFFSFGYERFEVLVVFASTILAQFGSLFIVKESVERMFIQPEVHTGRLLVGTLFAFLFHIFVTYNIENRAFNHVVSASSSSWLQEHVTDMSESLCHVVPGLAKLLLPRINPFALIAWAGALALVVTHVLIDMSNYYAADTWASIWIALMTCGTMFPMSAYSGKILLQTTPSYIIGQLDKCIREASTLDGVLEFRHEHFWTVAFGKMAGSVHVRVRRDADEQMVVAHVYHRLANLVSVLTVQIFKDDWSRPSSFQILGDTALLSVSPAPAAGRPAPDAAPGGRLPMVPPPPVSVLQTAAGSPYSAAGSYRNVGPTGVAVDRSSGAGSAAGFVSHAGVRFPPIPHYTDINAAGFAGIGGGAGSHLRFGIGGSPPPAAAGPGFGSSAGFSSKSQSDKYK